MARSDARGARAGDHQMTTAVISPGCETRVTGYSRLRRRLVANWQRTAARSPSLRLAPDWITSGCCSDAAASRVCCLTFKCECSIGGRNPHHCIPGWRRSPGVRSPSITARRARCAPCCNLYRRELPCCSIGRHRASLHAASVLRLSLPPGRSSDVASTLSETTRRSTRIRQPPTGR